MMEQEKLLPLYSHYGAHIGTIALEKALASASAGDVSLRYKGRGRKARVTAVHVIFQRPIRYSSCALSAIDTENNGLAQTYSALGDSDSIHDLERSTSKVEAWAEIHDDRAVVVCAGKVYGATEVAARNVAEA